MIEITPLGQMPTPEGEMGGLFYSPGWLACLAETFGFRLVAAHRPGLGGRLVFAELDDVVGRRLVSLPYTDFTTPAVDAAELPGWLAALLAARPDHAFTLKIAGDFQGLNLPEGWRVGRAAMHHVVPLGATQSMWDATSSAFRRGVRKAERDGVEVRIAADTAAAERFHALYADHRRRKFHLLSQPLAFFQAAERHFFQTGKGFTVEAWIGGRMIAALLVLVEGDTAYYKLGASDVDALECRPNNLLFWHLMQRVADQGCARLDLGMSWDDPEDAGIIRFKDGLGARRHPIAVLRATGPSFDAAREAEARRLFQCLTAALTELPLDTGHADRLGGLLFHYFT